MAQHDAIVSNASGAAVRADLNNALAALITNSSGATSPATTYSYQFWADTTANQLKIRNSANDAWITLMELDGTMLMEDGSAATPGLAFADDVDTGLFRPAANQLGIATSGVERVEFGTTEVVFNDSGADVNFRVEGDTDANLLFVDAGNDRVGIGTAAPDSTFSVRQTAASHQIIEITRANSDTGCLYFGNDSSSNGIISTNNSDFIIGKDVSGSLTEHARIDTSGRLLLGSTSAIISGSLDNSLHLKSPSGSEIYFLRDDSGSTVAGNALGMIRFYGNDNDGTAQECARIECEADLDHGNDDKPSRLLFLTTADGASSPTERVRIDSSGRMLQGTTTEGNAAADDLTIATTGHTGITLRSGTSSEGAVYFSDGTSGNDEYRGFMVYNHSGNYLRFGTDSAEAIRILSNGSVGFGETNPSASIKVNNGSKTHTFAEFTGADNTALGLFLIHTSTSYAGDAFKLHHHRAATSAMNFLAFDSAHGSTPDREFTLRGDGNAYADGTWNNNGADYAEFFESTTGAAIPVGTTVVLENNKVRAATADDSASAIMGVIRPKEPGQASMTIGNAAWNKWSGKYMTDDFDRFILDEHVVYEWTEEVENGNDINHSYESHQVPDGITVPDDVVGQTHDAKGNRFVHYRLNPDWDPDVTYVPREERDEWVIVGLIGQVKILDGQPVNDRWIKMRDVSDAVEEWFIR